MRSLACVVEPIIKSKWKFKKEKKKPLHTTCIIWIRCEKRRTKIKNKHTEPCIDISINQSIRVELIPCNKYNNSRDAYASDRFVGFSALFSCTFVIHFFFWLHSSSLYPFDYQPSYNVNPTLLCFFALFTYYILLALDLHMRCFASRVSIQVTQWCKI